METREFTWLIMLPTLAYPKRQCFQVGEGIPGHSLTLICKEWRGYLSLGILKGMRFEAEAHYSSKIV